MTSSQPHEIHESVGETLKSLRKERNLSIQDIALQMHLEPRIIEALENNNYETLPASTYVRGYIRSYAKIVKVDADTIITLYNNDAPEPPEIIPEVKHPTQVSSSDKPVKAFTYLIIFIFVLLMLVWLQSNFMIRDLVLPDTNKPQQETTTGTGNLSYPVVVVEHPEMPSYTEVTEPDEILDTGGAEQPASPDSSLALAADEKLQLFEPVEIIGSDTILLNVTADSWVEIYDANDKKLFLDLARSGETLSLRGTAPFNVKLGFAQGITLEFNGEPFDVAPFSRAGVARFVLGE